MARFLERPQTLFHDWRYSRVGNRGGSSAGGGAVLLTETMPVSAADALEDPPVRPARRLTAVTGDLSIHAVTTLVLWTCCLASGLVGFLVLYPAPSAHAGSEAPPVRAERVVVELAPPLPVTDSAELPLPDLHSPPPAPERVLPEPAPRRIPVAEASPRLQFALPVQQPSQVVPLDQAAHVVPREFSPNLPSSLPVQTLAYGRGEGRQPAPHYPRAAIRQGQEGTVTVQFTVGETGRVLSAEIVSPSQWPLLNEAALTAVRERWRFAPGQARLYEVPIHFQLKN